MYENDLDDGDPRLEDLWEARQELRSAAETRREWAGDEYAESNYYGEVR